MKQNKMDRMLSYFDEDAALLLMIPLYVMAIGFGFLDGTLFFTYLAICVFYYLVTSAKLHYYRRLSRKRGLQFFTVYPSWAAPLIYRRKLGITEHLQVSGFWRIHVNFKNLRGVKNLRKTLQMRSEDLKILAREFDKSEAFIIGCTYAAIGHLQVPNARHDEIRVRLFPTSNFLFSKGRMLKEQQRIFGRVLSNPEKISWVTHTFYFSK
ncbi:hypothetical protein ACFSR7_06185 [Cohnella sp. GCM10020058]|uniref:hypothetical protein n=1 Tax=Cohnella sp. GCM10020058 TaxID=3317330 RepID=UPI00363EB4D4